MSDRDDIGPTGPLTRFIEDDEGGTIATSAATAQPGEAALPFRAAPPPSGGAYTPRPSPGLPPGLPAAYAAPLANPPAPAPPPVPPPMQPPPAPPPYAAPSPAWGASPPPTNAWGGGQASAFAPPRPVVSAPQLRTDDEMKRAAALGAGAVSNAAIPIEATPPKPIGVLAKPRPAAEEAPQRASARVELLAVDRLEMERIRASKHLAERKDDELVDEWQSSEPEPQATLESKDRAAAHRALARATPMVLDELEGALGAALDASAGSYPVVLVAGELSIVLDPLDSLRALRGYASAWANPQDKRLGEAIELVDGVLASPVVLPDAMQIARARLDDALRASGRPALREVEPVIDRTLLEQRSFARRNVFGDRRVLAHLDGSTTPMPIYMSDTIARELPLMKRFLARVLVEVRPQQDAGEAHPLALRALALGRVVPLPRRR